MCKSIEERKSIAAQQERLVARTDVVEKNQAEAQLKMKEEKHQLQLERKKQQLERKKQQLQMNEKMMAMMELMMKRMKQVVINKQLNMVFNSNAIIQCIPPRS
jgi:DNA-binding response OmpR family regulator